MVYRRLHVKPVSLSFTFILFERHQRRTVEWMCVEAEWGDSRDDINKGSLYAEMYSIKVWPSGAHVRYVCSFLFFEPLNNVMRVSYVLW